MVAILALFALPHVLMAQSSQGSIRGAITDAMGAVVSGARIQVVATETGVVRTTKTNASGIYIVTDLNPGDYTVTVMQTGFEQAVTNHVTVSAAQQSTVSSQLKVGSSTAEVVVTAEDSLLTKDESNVTTTVDRQLVEDLPYPERSALEAALLVPGVNGDPLAPGGISTENPNAFLSVVAPGATISIGGGAPGTSSIYVDGSDVTQASFPRAGINVSGRIVKETSVLVTGASAKYGRTSSGVIVQNTRGGSNAFHGAVTWRHTDPWFNAYPDGSSAANDQHENFYGFYVGGPIRIPKVYNGRDKTFFYIGVEPARLRIASSSRGTFYTPDELAGNLNNSLGLLNQATLRSSGAAAALAAPRTGGLYYQTAMQDGNGFPKGPQLTSTASWTKPVTSPNVADCGPNYTPPDPANPVCVNNVKLQLANNPFAQFVFSQFPTPSNPGPHVKFDNAQGLWASDGTNGVYARGAANIDNRYSFRIDHQFSQVDQIWGRFTNVPLTNQRFFALANENPIQPVPSDSAYSKDVAVGYTHAFTGNLLNNFHYSYMRVVQNRLPPPSSTSQDYAAKYGLTPATTGQGFPYLGTFTALNQASSYAYSAGVPSANPMAVQRDQNFIGGDDVSWVKGRHLIQFGVDLRWIQSNQYALAGDMGGNYSFSQNQTGNGTGGLGLATFVLGTISSFSNTPVNVPGYYRWRYDAGYIQDDYKVLHNLTLNLGLRYEVETPRMEKNNNQGYVRFGVPGTLNGIPADLAFCFSGACGSQKTLFPTNWWGIEPRIGIAYAPTNRTTLRGSFGIMRIPLTGYENVPDPNFNLNSVAVQYSSGAGTNPLNVVNYITNKVNPANLTSGFTQLGSRRGPLYYINGALPISYVDQSNAVPYTENYSATFQYQATSKLLLQASYQGLRGLHLIGPFTVPLNTPNISAITAAIQAKIPLGNNATITGNPYHLTNSFDGSGPCTPTCGVTQEKALQQLNPYQNWFDQNLAELYPRHGIQKYNALYLSLNQRFGKGLSFLANYTWQKSLDDIPDTNPTTGGGFGSTAQQNPFDLRSEYSVSSFDQANRFKYGVTYHLPFGKGGLFSSHGAFVNALLGDFQVAGIGSNNSGYPNFVTLGTSGNFYSVVPLGTNNCTGSAAYCIASGLPSGYTLRPNRVPGVPVKNPNWKKNPFNPTAAGGITPYLNVAAFSVPGDPGNPTTGVAPTPAFGNVPRTMADARTPREMFFDLRLTKGFTLRDRYHLNFNVNLNNAFNHPIYYALTNNKTDTLVACTASTSCKDAHGNPLPAGTLNHQPVANFGTISQGNTSSMSRVIRIGAEFTF